MPDNETVSPLIRRRLRLTDRDIDQAAEIGADDVLIAAAWFREAAPPPYARLLDADEREKFE